MPRMTIKNDDKFVLFSTVWNKFVENCQAYYKSEPYLIIEQLFPSKARCPFT